MSKRRILTALFFTFLLISGTSELNAQTPKKTSTTKSTAKKPVAKKKVAVKKTGNVFICDGVGGYNFHRRKSCAVLIKCKGRILNIPKQDATGQFHCKQCKKCY